MGLDLFKTYKRRVTTRTSGFTTNGETTGGECIIESAFLHEQKTPVESYKLTIDKLSGVTLFLREDMYFAFGGFIHSKKKGVIDFNISYVVDNIEITPKKVISKKVLNNNTWNPIGFFFKIDGTNLEVENIKISMEVSLEEPSDLEFTSFDYGFIEDEYYVKNDVYDIFSTKTSMHIPTIFFFEQNKSPEFFIDKEFTEGRTIVLKSCNRCGRFLPINIDNERNTLSFSNHCVKNAPCTHSNFYNYKIQNPHDEELPSTDTLTIENHQVISYHGHQLECVSCKKFYVNAPLNPQRNAQQFKEDGLRRRATERLVNLLLNRKLVHHEFEFKTKKEFTKFIWDKFEHKCFKCGKELKQKEMHLDHTMPLAYFYRLDEHATCLCAEHNSSKRDKFPSDFYDKAELISLSEYTDLPLEYLEKKEINHEVLDKLVENVTWFFDDFLMAKDYQKIRDGILTADKVYQSIVRVIPNDIDLSDIYKKKTGIFPQSITNKKAEI